MAGCEDLLLKGISWNNIVGMLGWASQPQGSLWLRKQIIRSIRDNFAQVRKLYKVSICVQCSLQLPVEVSMNPWISRSPHFPRRYSETHISQNFYLQWFSVSRPRTTEHKWNRWSLSANFVKWTKKLIQNPQKRAFSKTASPLRQGFLPFCSVKLSEFTHGQLYWPWNSTSWDIEKAVALWAGRGIIIVKWWRHLHQGFGALFS